MADGETTNATGQSAVNREGGLVGFGSEMEEAAAHVLGGGALVRLPSVMLERQQWHGCIMALRDWVSRETLRRVRRAGRFGSIEERVYSILRDSSLSLRVTEALGKDAARDFTLARIRIHMERGEPIVLALLLGGAKAPVALKSGDGYLPDLAESIAFAHLGAIVHAIEEVYSKGAVILAISDAPLHTDDLGMPMAEIVQHLEVARADVLALGLADVVVLPNPLDHLPNRWTETVSEQTRTVLHEMRSNGAARHSLEEQVRSLQFTLNTRVRGGEFERTVLVYAALAGRREGLPPEVHDEAEGILRQCIAVTPHYAAVNSAIRQAGLVEEIVCWWTQSSADHIRLSVHAKGRPPEYRPRLVEAGRYAQNLGMLPMHSQGVFALDPAGEAQFGLTFEIRARIRGWVPHHDAVTGRFLFWSPRAPRDHISTDGGWAQIHPL